MKASLHLKLLLVAASLAAIPMARAQQQPPILNSLGERLENPQIKSFDGKTFEVIHTGGVSRVPWEKMPEAYRAGYHYDPERGAREQARRLQQSARDVRETQRRENIIIKDQGTAARNRGPVNPPVATAAGTPEMRRVERTIPMLSPTNLGRLGGPNTVISIHQINPLEIQYRLRRGPWRTVPLKPGASDSLTLLFDDGAGCRTYFLDRLSRNPNEAILVFERSGGGRGAPVRR